MVRSEFIPGGESGNDQTVYTAPVGKEETFGNKLTGQIVPSTYGERQTGDAFGGTVQVVGGFQNTSDGNLCAGTKNGC